MLRQTLRGADAVPATDYSIFSERLPIGSPEEGLGWGVDLCGIHYSLRVDPAGELWAIARLLQLLCLRLCQLPLIVSRGSSLHALAEDALKEFGVKCDGSEASLHASLMHLYDGSELVDGEPRPELFCTVSCIRDSPQSVGVLLPTGQ